MTATIAEIQELVNAATDLVVRGENQLQIPVFNLSNRVREALKPFVDIEPNPATTHANQTIYYLKSIERQLRQIAEEQDGVSLGGEVLWDNLNWLGTHIEYLEKMVSK